jgi:hypothetical protein
MLKINISDRKQKRTGATVTIIQNLLCDESISQLSDLIDRSHKKIVQIVNTEEINRGSLLVFFQNSMC